MQDSGCEAVLVTLPCADHLAAARDTLQEAGIPAAMFRAVLLPLPPKPHAHTHCTKAGDTHPIRPNPNRPDHAGRKIPRCKHADPLAANVTSLPNALCSSIGLRMLRSVPEWADPTEVRYHGMATGPTKKAGAMPCCLNAVLGTNSRRGRGLAYHQRLGRRLTATRPHLNLLKKQRLARRTQGRAQGRTL